jgi:hypothetical protein
VICHGGLRLEHPFMGFVLLVKCKSCGGTFETIHGLGKHLNGCKNGIYTPRESFDASKVKQAELEPVKVNSKRSRTSAKDPEKEEIEKSLLESLRGIVDCDVVEGLSGECFNSSNQIFLNFVFKLLNSK